MKRKYSLSLAVLAVAATSLSGCFGKKKTQEAGKITFWSSFGTAYTNALNPIVDAAASETGVEVTHIDHKSYDRINEDMLSAISDKAYPNIAMGYPDHFAKYLGRGILTPLNDYLSDADIADYYSEYMAENHFYDEDGNDKIYALPFNKSTELLGYNGVFVDYCATVNPELASIPATWQEWAAKGPLYNDIYKGLIMHWEGSEDDRTSTPGKKVYGVQDAEGRASGFEVLDANAAKPAGKDLLLDFSKVDPDLSLLMSWDATDNAFITLTRQWDAEYTKVEGQQNVRPKNRVGEVHFNSSTNQPKVISMLRFFNELHDARIFGTPSDLGGNYSSDGFANGNVMFMVCSSGGLSYNTAKWNHRFRVAPVPYYAGHTKYVISQGANICMTNQGNFADSVKVIRALTSGKFQTQWCLDTGYYPCSRSAYESQDYENFLTEADRLPASEAYASPTRVAYREGSKINSEHYMSSSEGWVKFVDPAFPGSSDLRKAVKPILSTIFKSVASGAADSAYAAKLNELKSSSLNPDINTSNFEWVA
jgi:ABC-type glycerol-3-phosphate transport system substrate-binding protein